MLQLHYHVLSPYWYSQETSVSKAQLIHGTNDSDIYELALMGGKEVLLPFLGGVSYLLYRSLKVLLQKKKDQDINLKLELYPVSLLLSS